MPFCFECGDELKGTGKLLSCNSCGWSSDSIQNIGNSVKPKSCPDCGKMGKTMRQCGVCRETWFCSWCHSQRKRDLRRVFDKSNGLFCDNGYNYWMAYPGSEKTLGLVKSFDSYEPCLSCAKKLVIKLTDKVISDVKKSEYSSDKKKEEYIGNYELRRDNIQISLGFNKKEMFKSPLD